MKKIIYGIAIILSVESFLRLDAMDFTNQLMDAAGSGNLILVQQLVNQGTNINVQDDFGETPLHCAADHGHLNVVEWLVGHGVNINHQNKYGYTPLARAAYNGHLNVVEWLVGHGANINLQDNNGITPLYSAAFSGHLNVVEWLVDHGANINVQDNEGSTPLHEAAFNGHLNVVEWLVGHGASINVQDNEGSTPLRWASESGMTEVSKTLLHHGADINVKSCDGKTPLEVARNENKQGVVQLLNDWPLYQSYRNRQIAAFLVGQDKRVGENSPTYQNLDRNLFNHIVQLVRSEWKHDTVDQIHEIAELERQKEILSVPLGDQENFLKRRFEQLGPKQPGDEPEIKKRKIDE